MTDLRTSYMAVVDVHTRSGEGVVWKMDARERVMRKIPKEYDLELHTLAAAVFGNRADVNPQVNASIGLVAGASSGTAADESGRTAGEPELVDIGSSSEGEQAGAGLRVSGKRRRRSAGLSEAATKRSASSSGVGAVLTDMASSLKDMRQGRQTTATAMLRQGEETIRVQRESLRVQQQSFILSQKLTLVSMGLGIGTWAQPCMDLCTL